MYIRESEYVCMSEKNRPKIFPSVGLPVRVTKLNFSDNFKFLVHREIKSRTETLYTLPKFRSHGERVRVRMSTRGLQMVVLLRIECPSPFTHTPHSHPPTIPHPSSPTPPIRELHQSDSNWNKPIPSSTYSFTFVQSRTHVK